MITINLPHEHARHLAELLRLRAEDIAKITFLDEAVGRAIKREAVILAVVETALEASWTKCPDCEPEGCHTCHGLGRVAPVEP